MSYKKIGFIGFGKWVKNAYLPFIQKLEDAEISYVCARSESTILEAQKIIGDQCKYTCDYNELLEDSELDLVILSVPDEMHGQIMNDILSKNIDCIFEMPIAEKKIISEKLIAITKSKKNLIVPNLEFSHLPIISKLHKYVINKSFGELSRVNLKLLSPGWGPIETSIKTIYSISPWYIDVLNKILGVTPKRVLSVGEKNPTYESESKGFTILDYDDYWGFWDYDIESSEKLSVTLDMVFDNASIKVDLINSKYEIVKNEVVDKFTEDFFTPVQGWPGMNEFLQHFFNNDLSREEYINEIETLQNISSAMESSLQKNKWINL